MLNAKIISKKCLENYNKRSKKHWINYFEIEEDKSYNLIGFIKLLFKIFFEKYFKKHGN